MFTKKKGGKVAMALESAANEAKEMRKPGAKLKQAGKARLPHSRRGALD